MIQSRQFNSNYITIMKYNSINTITKFNSNYITITKYNNNYITITKFINFSNHEI